MPEVMDANIFQPGFLADRPPWFLEVDEMLAPRQSR
jgi:hypothetical protein